MTESEWLTSTDPVRMLDWLGGTPGEGTDREGRRYAVWVSERKLRLYAVAMWRSARDSLDRLGYTTQDLDDLFRVGERIADGLATDEEVRALKEALRVELRATGLPCPPYVRQATRHIITRLTPREFRAERRRWFGRLIRCIVGNPWQPVATEDEYLHDFAIQESLLAVSRALGRRNALDRIIRTDWLTSDVLAIARSIYDDHCFSELPILADALVDAGCDCADLLGHLRGPGPHARGCWVVDLLLGKE